MWDCVAHFHTEFHPHVVYSTRSDKHAQWQDFNILSDRIALHSHFKLRDDLSTSVCRVFISVHLWTECAIWAPALPGKTPVSPRLSLFSQDQFVIHRPVGKDRKYLAITATKHRWVSLSTSYPFWFSRGQGHQRRTNCSGASVSKYWYWSFRQYPQTVP